MIRRAQPDDLPALCVLWRALMAEHAAMEPRFVVEKDAAVRWRNDAREWLRSEAHRILVAEEAGQVVGFVNALPWHPPPIHPEELEVYVQELYVAPEYRRRGLATELMGAVEAWASQVRAVRVRLAVLAANEGGRKLWEAVGMTPLALTYTKAVKN